MTIVRRSIANRVNPHPNPLPGYRAREFWAIAFLTVLVARTALASTEGATWRVVDITKHAANATLKLETKVTAAESTCTVTDTTAGERAVTLSLVLPLDAVGGTWWDDPQRSRRIDKGSFQNLSDKAGGIDDSASLYPLVAVTPAHGNTATCLAVPLDEPRMVRFVYDADKRELRAEFDFGLSPAPQRFPSRAHARVIAFEVPADHAFRRAVARYWEMFPQLRQRRVKSAGTWLPFGESGPIKEARDFGFAFHEIAEHQAAVSRILDDDARVGCGSYVYVEPPTYWQQYTGKGKGTYDERRRQLEEEAKSGSEIAQATIVSGVLRGDGKRDLYLDPVAYTPRQPWGSSADPDITDADKSRNWSGKGKYDLDRLTSLLSTTPNLEGVYVDSSEGWGGLLDYDREHWRVTKFPLTFDPSTKKVALLNFWGTVAWVQKMHAVSGCLMANDVFFRRWQLAGWVDVPGREYTWLDIATGKLAPVDDEHYLFIKSMSGRRPYLMLMNNRFDDASIMEPYFQRSVFYAVWPSMFSGQTSAADVAYFDNPAWYNRDRALFKKYLPMVRKLDDAGWQPVTFASIDPPDARIERYGSFKTRDLAFTIHNPTAEARDVTITLSHDDLHPPAALEAMEWFTNKPVDVIGDAIRVRLSAGGYGVVSVTPAGRR